MKDSNPMQNIESMEALVVEIKSQTKSCRDTTLEKLDELYKILQDGEENSEESTVLIITEAELGGEQ